MDSSTSSALNLNSRTFANLRKTGCRRYAAMTYAGVDAQKIAASKDLVAPPVDRRAAYEFGSRFEEFLMRDDAKRLINALRNFGLVGSEVKVVNFGGRSVHANRLEILSNFEHFLGTRVQSPVGEVLLVGAVLPFPGIHDSSLLLPDVLLMRDGSSYPIPIEIKAYEERGVLSPQAGIDSAAAQCGLYALAFDSYPGFPHVGSDPHRDEAILVFRDPGKRRGSAFRIDVSRARALASAGLDLVPSGEDAFVIEFGFTPSDAIADNDKVLSVKASFCDSCSSLCPLYRVCAVDASSSSCVLGDSFVQLVGERSLTEIDQALTSTDIHVDDVGLQLLLSGTRELLRI